MREISFYIATGRDLFTLHKGMANVRQFVVDTLLESDIPCIEGEKYLETFWRKKL